MSQENGRGALIHQAIDLMIRTSRLHHRNIEKLFDDTGLHRSQRRMLMHLSRCETMPSQRRIADDFDISPACVARTLKSLAGEGYIIRTGDEDDLRRNTVAITEKGLGTVQETRCAFEQIDLLAFEGLSDAEIRQLADLLGRVQENLHKLEDTESNPHIPEKGSVSQ